MLEPNSKSSTKAAASLQCDAAALTFIGSLRNFYLAILKLRVVPSV